MNDPTAQQSLRAKLLWASSPTAVHFIDDGVISVDSSGRISAVIPFDAYSGPPPRHLKDTVIVPGFVDAHVHYPQTRIVGSATGPLLDWLKNSTFPEEAKFSDTAYAAIVAEEFLTKLASAGTTTAFVYGSVHPAACDALFTAASRFGSRIIAGPVLMDCHAPDVLLLDAPAALDGLSGLLEKWHGHDEGRLSLAVIPRFALTASPSLLSAAGDFARKHSLWVSTHLSENREECAVATGMFGTADYLAVYEDAGLLHERSLYAHAIHLSESEWSRFADSGAAIAHCPDSNFFLGSGRMPIGVVRERGIPYAIGTDIAAGRSFRVPMSLSAAYDNALAIGQTMTPTELLWAGTGGGADVLGLAQVGSLKAGHWADFAAFGVDSHINTAQAALSSVIFDHDTGGARAAWVRGREVFTAEPSGSAHGRDNDSD